MLQAATITPGADLSSTTERGNARMSLPPGISPIIMLRSLFNGISVGLYMAGSSVFFIKYIGLTPQQVGLGLSVAWLISTATMVPFGMLADHFGGRTIWSIGTIASAAVFCLYPFAEGYWQFQLIVGLALLFAGLGSCGYDRYLGDLLPEGSRVRGSAFLRTTSNVGMALGAAIAGVAISFGTRPGYLAIVLITAGGTAVEAALIMWAVPNVDRRHRPTKSATPRKPIAIRDRSFVAVSLLNAAFLLNGPVLSVVLPLWILSNTDGPAWLIAGTLLANMILVVVLQIPASRGVETPSDGARAWARSGIALAVACVSFAVSGTTGGWATVVSLAMGLVALTAGELFSAAASWAVRYGLSPESRRGEYIAVFRLGGLVSWIAGPAVLSFLVVAGGPAGWLVLAGGFVAAATVARPMVRWANRQKRGEEPQAEIVPALGGGPGTASGAT
ncbi:MFS transporter [Micromonospora sp. DR5-3]|uniref:MFS transporter n=1 Tax=unclassified Micromonospora TaxID=2617518 RepID=UPI0011D67B93|nr:MULTISPECIES: MFS transporter [unclassified Micromonospora]MCW3815806.1 MFS transporter [Micromonospora sp. DR5-3]TYC21211.1 MFS transporter [Micromonospora sp. MP36]